MAEYVLGEREKERLKDISRDLSDKNKAKIEEMCQKGRATIYDIDDLGRQDTDTLPLYIFFSGLKLAPRQTVEYKASEAFVEKTRRLKLQQENREYKELVKDVDPSQRYGQPDYMENFGTEVRSLNRQLMSVFNVLITVVCGFFFGFTGVTYLYPHLHLDLTIRFMIGLVFATIIFFADLYFVVKSMDEPAAPPRPQMTTSDKVKRTFVVEEEQPQEATEEVHKEKKDKDSSAQKRRKPKKAW